MLKMNIKETFLKLTSRTYPHGTEHQLFDLLPQDLDMDEFGNLFKQIGTSDVMFTSHLDTATSANTTINHVEVGKLIQTDGKSILGADDKAGVTIMLNMIENNITGLYYFFLGEEVGCVGSKKLSEKHKKEKLPYINKVISFDRRDLDSVITFQASSRCCSDKFAIALSEQLNLADKTFKYSKDPTGVYTDSAQFTKIYPECTNISVGYYSEHTFNERQDIEHLVKLADAVLKVDWNNLPVDRDPAKVEYDSYYGGSWGFGGNYPRNSRYSTYDDYEDWYSEPSKTTVVPKETKMFFHDTQYNYVSSFTTNNLGIYTAVDIHSYRLDDERENIYEFLQEIEVQYQSMKWDGVKLVVTYEGSKSEATRNDLIEYLPQLDLAKLSEEKEASLDDTYAYKEEWDEYHGDM
jgi:hypothetical protein